jgi:hypothetical protein
LHFAPWFYDPACFASPYLLHFRDDRILRNILELEQFAGFSAFRHPSYGKGVDRHCMLRERASDGFPDPTLGNMVLDRDDRARIFRRPGERRRIDRLDAVQVDDADHDPFLPQLFIGFERLMHGDACTDHRGYILPVRF